MRNVSSVDHPFKECLLHLLTPNLKRAVLAALGHQSYAISGQTCGPISVLCEFTSGPCDTPNSPTAPPKPLTSPPRTPTPNHALQICKSLLRMFWLMLKSPPYLSKTSLEKKEGLFGEGGVPGYVWG